VAQRVINAALGGSCQTGAGVVPHSVTLNWNASSSSNVAGYNIYRGATPSGPYTKLNPALIPATSYLDGGVRAGLVYYYVVTTVDSSNNESVPSNEASATLPTT
jgi:fibronectin type 3 domain-containing protein